MQDDEKQEVDFIVEIIHFSLVVFMFFMNCWADYEKEDEKSIPSTKVC